MKNLLLLYFLMPLSIFANSEKPTTSKIEKVTVYLEGASIERTSSINLISGENTFVFNNLSPDIDENSIQVSGLGDASIISIVFNIDFLEKKETSQEYKSLENLLKTFQQQKNQIENEITGYNEELQLLQKNQRINSDATNLTVEMIKEMSVYYRNRVTEIKNEIFKQQLLLSELSKSISAHQSELLKLDDSKKEQRGEITLKLNNQKPANLVLKLKYNIKNAGWFPLYDIRATNTSSPIEFSYKANVYQQSGTDWENVNVVLSTGDPNTNNIKPKLFPKYLNFNNRSYASRTPVRNTSRKYNPTIHKVSGTVYDDTGLPLPGVNVIIAGTSQGTQTDFDGNYAIDVQGYRELTYSYVGFETEKLPIYASTMNVSMIAGSALEEVVVTGYSSPISEKSDWLANRAKGIVTSYDPSTSYSEAENLQQDNSIMIKESGLTTTRFEIREKYTIKSNAEITVIAVDEFELPALFQHYAAPELNENVFLTATIKNWEKFDFLAGEANIYFEGNYAGKSFIDPQATADTLNLSLGMDPNIIVKREKLENFKSKSFLGGTRIVAKGYTIEVKNNKKTPITLVLEDRIPISENKEIKVEDVETGLSEYNDKTGIMRWKLQLPPNATDKKEFTYTVKYPKYKKVYL
ncbi:MAG TPA: mucoidy inhibitor MuiA family protein [Aequorivita sp.]|nr:mucoidy inhibitor MuiA family protein [Aequorivita sp.]